MTVALEEPGASSVNWHLGKEGSEWTSLHIRLSFLPLPQAEMNSQTMLPAPQCHLAQLGSFYKSIPQLWTGLYVYILQFKSLFESQPVLHSTWIKPMSKPVFKNQSFESFELLPSNCMQIRLYLTWATTRSCKEASWAETAPLFNGASDWKFLINSLVS